MLETQREKPKEYVYLVRAGDFLKIGISNEVSVRVEKFKTACPLDINLIAVIEGGRAKEKELHRLFKHLKTQGEWFHFSNEIMKSFGALHLYPVEEKDLDYGDLVLVTKGYYKGTVGEYDDDSEEPDENGTAVIVPHNREDLPLNIVVKKNSLRRVKY